MCCQILQKTIQQYIDFFFIRDLKNRLALRGGKRFILILKGQTQKRNKEEEEKPVLYSGEISTLKSLNS